MSKGLSLLGQRLQTPPASQPGEQPLQVPKAMGVKKVLAMPKVPPAPREPPGLAAGKDRGDPRGQEQQGCCQCPVGERGQGLTEGQHIWGHRLVSQPRQGTSSCLQSPSAPFSSCSKGPRAGAPPPARNTWGASEALSVTLGAHGRPQVLSHPVPPWQVPRSQQDTQG